MNALHALRKVAKDGEAKDEHDEPRATEPPPPPSSPAEPKVTEPRPPPSPQASPSPTSPANARAAAHAVVFFCFVCFRILGTTWYTMVYNGIQILYGGIHIIHI